MIHVDNRLDSPMTMEEAAEVLKVHPRTVISLCRKGYLQHTRLSSVDTQKWRTKLIWIVEYMEKNSQPRKRARRQPKKYEKRLLSFTELGRQRRAAGKG